MTWVDGDFHHEGHVATVFFDGMAGASSTPHGPLATVSADGTDLPYAQWVQRTAADVSGWQCRCDCGWRGQPWTRVQDLVDEDRATRQAFDEDDTGWVPAWVEDVCHPEWQAHIADLHDDLCPVRTDGDCLCAFIATVRVDQDRKRGR